jgi:hypothetical protein
MLTLQDAALSGDELETARLLDRRLCGDQQEAPFAGLAGLRASDIVLEIYQREECRPAIENAIGLLLGERAHKELRSLGDNEEQFESLFWLLELMALIERIGVGSYTRQLGILAASLPALDPTNRGLRQVQLAAVRAVARAVSDEEILVGLFGLAYRTINDARDYSLALAGVVPSLFLEVLAPQVVRRFEDLKTLDKADFDFLEVAVVNAVSALQSASTDCLSRELESFIMKASSCAEFQNGHLIRQAICAGLARAPIRVSALARFEDEYWRKFPRLDFLNPKDIALNSSTKFFGEDVRGKYPFKRTTVTSLRMNPIPYAEGALLQLFSLVMKAAYDIDIHFQKIDYRSVLQALTDGDIDLAAHTPYILEQLSTASGAELVESPRLIHFKKYELLASHARLRDLVSARLFEDDIRAMASELLGGEKVGEDIAAETRPRLQRLISELRIAVQASSDTHGALQKWLGEIPGAALHDVDSDEGLRQLLDGDVGFYIGGAVQASYALNVCPSRAVHVADVPETVNVHFFTLQSRYDASPDASRLFQQCVVAWQAVKDLWSALTSPDENMHPRLRPLLGALRRELPVGVNCHRDPRKGYARSFVDLAQIIATHDDLLSPLSRSPLFAATGTYTKENRWSADAGKTDVAKVQWESEP